MMKYLPVTSLFAILLMALAACVKNDPPIPDATTVNINVVNGSEDVLNYYLNGTRQNSTTGIFPLGASGYTAIPYGGLLTFKRVFNNQTFENADALFSVPVNVDTTDADNSYSLFVAGLTAENAFFVRDTLTGDSKNARLRFVVASPQVTKLQVYLNDTLRFATTTFKSNSGFNLVGNGVKRLEIKDANTGAVLYSTSFSLMVSRVYTLFTQGNTANSTFKAGLISNQ
jgi:hypothetical protein